MQFDAIIWDFDGTLFDSYPPLIGAVERGLGELGLAEPRHEISRLLLASLDECIVTLAARYGFDADTFGNRVVAAYARTDPAEIVPYPGVVTVCEQFVQAGGMNTIFTHRRRETALALLEAHQVDALFAECLTTNDGYPRKPDPAGFVALIGKYGWLPERVLAIGDRDLDIQAGQGAGVRTCAYIGQISPGVVPDFHLTHFDELAAILGL